MAEGSNFSSVSATGRYVAFDSLSPCLVIPDANPRYDVFVSDLKHAKTELVSVSSQGLQGIGDSTRPSVTPDARYITFISEAANLVPGDTNLVPDVFVRDRRLGTTERVSVSSDGSEGNLRGVTDPNDPSISPDGRFVSFASASSNLVGDDNNGVGDVFVHDRQKDNTTRVSISTEGTEANGESRCPSISGDRRYVAFTSSASNLVEGDSNAWPDTFVRDLRTGQTERISVASDGAQVPLGGGACGRVITSDGRYVTFSSQSVGLVPNDTYFGGLGSDVFVHDRRTGRIERISVTSDGEEATTGTSGNGSLSGNGRVISFTSFANDLACCGDTGSATEPVFIEGDPDVLVHGLRDGSTEYASIGHDGSEATGCGSTLYSGYSVRSSMSYGGRFVSFSSCAENLETEDSGASDFDIFLRDRGTALGVGELVASGQADRLSLEGSPGFARNGVAFISDLSNDALTASLDGSGELIGARIAYRPLLDDIFVVLELKHMPSTPALAAVTAGTLYGMSFTLDGTRYEIRSASTGLGPHGETTALFGLFSCSGQAFGLGCRKVADLNGGFGTTGERITFSVPLDDLGIKDGSVIADASAYTALGSYYGGSLRTVDVAEMPR